MGGIYREDEWVLGTYVRGSLTWRVRFSGTENAVKDSIQAARDICRRHNARKFEGVTTKKEMDSLWSARREAALVAVALKPEGTVLWATDVAVPISRMADLIGELAPDLVKVTHRLLLIVNRGI